MNGIRILAPLAAWACAVAACAQSGAELLDRYAEALNKAEGLKVEYTVQVVGGASQTYRVSLAKPNRARIEKPNQTVVADGSEITFYDPKEKTYYKRKQTQDELVMLFSADELALWAPFFDRKAFDVLSGAKKGNPVNRLGRRLEVVKVEVQGGSKALTFYLDQSDRLARQLVIETGTSVPKQSTVVDARGVAIAKPVDDVFAFVGPEGSKQISEEDLKSDQWFTSLDDALANAKKTKRRVLLDFYADW